MAMMMLSVTESATIHHQYHRQLRMQIYSKPNYSGQVQTIRASQDHGKNSLVPFVFLMLLYRISTSLL